jgi:carbonic anhydrase/acetyltransferase-like protein (isoleucine patch superfamily)
MLIESGGKSPTLHPDAWVAPDATICGDVHVGAGARIAHGARVIAESGGRIAIGADCIVLENAVIRATARHGCAIGDHCLIGPNTHVVGAQLADRVFVATGASVFHGARLEANVEVRINAVVHIATHLAEGATVPIGWIAVGAPAELFSPEQHEAIWARQKPLDFPRWVYDVDRGDPDVMVRITQSMSAALARHRSDSVAS